MKGNDFDNILRNKVSEKEYSYSDAHWQSAKQFIDEKRASRRRWVFFYSCLAALTIGAASYALWPDHTNGQISSTNRSIKNTNINATTSKSNKPSSTEEYTEQKPSIKDHTTIEQTIGESISSTIPPIKSKQTPPKKNFETNSESPYEAIQEAHIQSKEIHATPVSSIALEEMSDEIPTSSALIASVSNQKTNDNNLISREGQASISDLVPTNHRIKESPLFLASYLMSTDDDESDIYIKSHPEKARKKMLQVGTYGQLYLTEKAVDVKYTIENDQLWSAGVLAAYPLTKSITLQTGLGYQHQQFDLSFTQRSISTKIVSDVETSLTTNVSTSQHWEYFMDFSAGVATSIDSMLVTVYDTSYVTHYDTFETIVSDTSHSTVKSNFVINSIEVPVFINYSKPFGRWEVFGGAGIHLNYATSIQVASNAGSEQEMPTKNQVKNFGLDASVQLGLSYIISPELKLSLAPTYRMNTTKRYEFIDRRSNYTGLTVSLLYRIR
jgi:hypothetical protein